MVGGRELETLELPGDPWRRPLVLLHEGLDPIGLWLGLPQQLSEATGQRHPPYSRFGHGRSIRRPCPCADVLPRGGARAPRGAGSMRRRGPDPRRPQRRRLDRADPRRAPSRHRSGADRRARVRGGAHRERDRRGAAGVHGGRAARAHGPPSRRSRRRVPGLVRRMAGPGVRDVGTERRRGGHQRPHARRPGPGRRLRHARPGGSHHGCGARTGHPAGAARRPRPAPGASRRGTGRDHRVRRRLCPDCRFQRR